MPNVTEQICEVKIEGTWRTACLALARSLYTMAPKRCPACHGEVILTGTYIGAGHLKLQHYRAHTGCPLKPATYTGIPLPHPQAVA